MVELFDPSITPVALSFIFVFAVVFGVLSYASTLKFPKAVNAAIAAVFAVSSAIYQPFVIFVQDIMPIASIFLIILFFLLLLKKAADGKDGDGKTDLILIGITMALLLVVLAAAGDRIAPFFPAGIDATGVYWLAGIIIILLFFWIGYKHWSQ
ncbi:MAG: hypothetical protein QMD85_05225 [Candidatus Aenigmarchaeota archaeon]|nr:hypothetical protein [Candidatus Aenigmarchaeota archaeon]